MMVGSSSSSNKGVWDTRPSLLLLIFSNHLVNNIACFLFLEDLTPAQDLNRDPRSKGFGTNALNYYYLIKPVRIIKLFSLLRGKKNEQAG